MLQTFILFIVSLCSTFVVFALYILVLLRFTADSGARSTLNPFRRRTLVPLTCLVRRRHSTRFMRAPSLTSSVVWFDPCEQPLTFVTLFRSPFAHCPFTLGSSVRLFPVHTVRRTSALHSFHVQSFHIHYNTIPLRSIY